MVGRQKAMDFRSATVRNGEFLDFLPETDLMVETMRNHFVKVSTCYTV